MNLELTISGLWVIVLKSQDDYPPHPTVVDVVIPNAHHHRPVLSYFPEDVSADVVPAMAIDPSGRRIAALDLSGKAIAIECTASLVTEFSLGWVSVTQKLPPPSDVFNWVPTLRDVGFHNFVLPADGSLPTGASARVRLPYGELVARNVVKEETTGGHALWEFPKASGQQWAVANEVLLSVRGCNDVYVMEGVTPLVWASMSSGTLRLSLSNDLTSVPKDYTGGVTKLQHLEHLDVLAAPVDPPPFDPPFLVPMQHTGKPICNGVRMIDKS